MPKQRSVFVLSLGGSLIVPNDGIDVSFLKKFREIILSHVRRGDRFIIICGGGATARSYQAAARNIKGLTRDDLDWLGIHATRMNAHLMRTIFRDYAHPVVIKDPSRKISWRQPILIGAGGKPGHSTDYDAVKLARQFGGKLIINLSNITYVYDKDPRKHRGAKPICEISWKEFRKLVGNRWDPGANLPFDPIAARGAERLGMRVIITDGKNIPNLKRILTGKNFQGTVIF